MSHPNNNLAAVAIGSSTGGPSALIDVLQHLRGSSQPIFITQHMDAVFSDILVHQLAHQSGVPCSEAIEGEIIRSGHAYLAPRDRHLTLRQFGADVRVTLVEPEGAAAYCPAVDPMLQSLVEIYGAHLCTVILSGMEGDGVTGARLAKTAGGIVIVQDNTSRMAHGMPEAVISAGLADCVLPLVAIGPQLRELLTSTVMQSAA